MLSKHITYIFAACSLLVSSFAMAADAAVNAPEKSRLCATCHGANGISISANIPNLARQKKDYILKALSDFRTGKRDDPVMVNIANGLSDSEIEELATFFSSM